MGWTRAWEKSLRARSEINRLFDIAEKQADILEKDRQLSDQENCLRLAIVSVIGMLQSYIDELINELCDRLPSLWDDNMPLYQKRYVLIQARKRLSAVLAELKDTDLSALTVNKHHGKLIRCLGWLNDPSSLYGSQHREDLRGFLKDNGTNAINAIISQLSTHPMSFKDWLYSRHSRWRDSFETLDIAIQVRNDAAHGTFNHRITMREARLYYVLATRLMLKITEYLDAGPTSALPTTITTTAMPHSKNA